jgi:hypothetical protein
MKKKPGFCWPGCWYPVRTPSQGYGEDLNSNHCGGGDPRYGKDGRRGTPLSVEDNEEENYCLVGKRDLRRLREVTPTEKSAYLEA